MAKLNKLITDFRDSIDDMTMTKKTSLLFLNMVVGMLFIGSFAHMSLNRIKDNFDVLYTKRMLPVIKLEKIKDIYTINILDTLRDIESSHISVEDGKTVIKLAGDLIERDWKEYKESLRIDDSDWIVKLARSWGLISKENLHDEPSSLEKDLLQNIEARAQKIDAILFEMFTLFSKSHTADAYNLLQEELYPSVNAINIYLTQLISLNLEAANAGKERTESVYNNTFAWIVAATVGTITVAALLATIILQNIRVLHGDLARRVSEKTKELQYLNIDLEKKIKKEVELSRQKDQIMFRQSRLAAMGEMVGNIAHQWRQPLNAIVLVIQSFQMKKMIGKLDDAFIDKQVDEGMKLANSMSRTIDDFRNYFKPNKVQENFSVKRVVQESFDLISTYYEKMDIELGLECEEDFYTHGYPNEFSQVLMNLFSNSKDVLKQIPEDEKRHLELRIQKNEEDEEGEILVIDNGGGIPDEVIERMFDPYFTTKHQSSGTGIGLFMSKEIIEKQMEGAIWAENITHKFLNDEKIYEKCACIHIVMPLYQGEE